MACAVRPADRDMGRYSYERRERQLHHDIGTIERMEIIRDLRLGEFDVLVGINLLREGLDIPEVGLVAILDADKEGFLRSETSLIQTVGRAARNADSKVIMYADTITPSMRACIDETARRREKQMAYNKLHGIEPKTIVKSVRDLIEISTDAVTASKANGVKMTDRERRELISQLEDKMKKVAGNLYITTDDGSYGSKGVVTNEIQKLVDAGNKYDVCVAIGPMIMMKFVCKLTKELEIPTVVSLNPIMVDGTGMCGACRVTVGGEVKFACVDGPEFDGHKVNFEEAMQRQQLYKTAEGRAFLAAKEGDTHHGGCGNCGGDK